MENQNISINEIKNFNQPPINPDNAPSFIRPADESILLDKVKEERNLEDIEIKFGLSEFCSFLGISPNLIYRKEKEGTLPSPRMEKKNPVGKAFVRTYSIQDVIDTRKFLDIKKPEVGFKVICFNNKKGGTGKSMEAFNFASFLACMGLKVLAIDMCGQGHMSSHLGVVPHKDMLCFGHLLSNEAQSYKDIIQKTPYPNLDLIPGTPKLDYINEYIVSLYVNSTDWQKDPDKTPMFFFDNELSKIKNDYDFIVIDTSPALDLRTRAVLLAVDFLIVPVQLAYEATLGMADFFEDLIHLKTEYPTRFKLKPENIKILPTFNNNHTISRFVLGFLQQEYGKYITENTIRESTIFKQATSSCKPIFLFNKKSDAAKDQVKFVREILNIKSLDSHLWM
ncbi:MAG: ParA family protein [Deltaproteobacteria bacterium]|nr:ParA family protein [Deltaproteobacteria bacterium]